MASMVKLIQSLRRILKREDIVNDGPAFRFHNTFTTVMLFGCSLIVTATQFVGKPIECIVSGLPTKPVNTFCWVTSTFIMPNTLHQNVGTEVAHPGMGNDEEENIEPKKYFAYYQWVCFALFFQGCFCYLPKLIWDNYEGGLMKTLVMGLNHYVYTEYEKRTKKQTIVNYMIQHIKRHRFYAVKYWICEFLCLLNVILQIYWMNRFFDGEFLHYGLRVLRITDHPQDKRIDPMIFVFPRVTKCIFRKFGPTGSIQEHDALCVLPLNVVNEKIYILVWFWFLGLVVILTALLVYRICLILMPSLRPKLLRFTRKIVSRTDAKVVARNLDVGDWWVLYILGKNLDVQVYNEVVIDLSRRLEDPVRLKS